MCVCVCVCVWVCVCVTCNVKKHLCCHHFILLYDFIIGVIIHLLNMKYFCVMLRCDLILSAVIIMIKSQLLKSMTIPLRSANNLRLSFPFYSTWVGQFALFLFFFFLTNMPTYSGLQFVMLYYNKEKIFCPTLYCS